MFKMVMKVAALLLPLLMVAPDARAENNQTVVLGIGAGGYVVGDDEIRPQGDRSQTLTHLYAEWYPVEQFGFGFRRSVMLNALGFAFLGLGTLDVLAVQTNMATVNWIVYGAQEYARVGLVAGAGNAQYEYDGMVLFGLGERHVKTSGSAALAGIFVDWGADGFGGRFGYDYISTDLSDVDVPGAGTLEADASGSALYLDLRWAF